MSKFSRQQMRKAVEREMNRRQNVFHALYRIHQELDRVMESQQFSEWFNKQKWIE